MMMALPKDIPTLELMAMKNWTRPDNVFCTPGLMDKLIFCVTELQLRGPGTDHVPILTKLELPVDRAKSPPTCSFRDVDWESFCKALKTNLLDIPGPDPIGSEEGLNTAVVDLTQAIQDAIGTTILFTCPSPHCKRWWMNDLDVAKRSKNRLS